MARRENNPPAKGGKKRSRVIDPYFNSRDVEGLAINTFDPFLADKDAALVMFYDPKDAQCEWSKKHFLKAAKLVERENSAFCAVDCTKEGELCGLEGVISLPYFKLYSRGKSMATYSNPRAFIYHDMRKYVENAPVLSDPPRPKRPCDIGKDE